MVVYNVQDNKCPSCNSNINWNANEQKFKCDYCNESYTLEEMKQYENSVTEENNLKKEINITEENMVSYICKNCGAEIIADENTISTFCVYCGNTAILKQKIDNSITPNYIIPFKKDKEYAKNAYIGFLKGKFLLPKKFRDEKNIEKITGIYIPFWAHDITIDGEVKIEGEDTRTWTSGDYEYEETKTYHVIIDGHYEFKKILCDASKNIKDDLMDSITPYNFDELEDYNHAYLSGYLADKYDVSCEESYKRAEKRSKNSAISCAKMITGHFSNTYLSDKYKYHNSNNYYILLPVWILNTKYKDKIYTFAMNGQTGKIIGNLPINILKFILISIGIFFLTLFIVIGIAFLIGGAL